MALFNDEPSIKDLETTGSSIIDASDPSLA